jgi:hypothetical protein
MLRIFPDHDFASTLRQLVDRVKQPNETVTPYYFGKLDLLRVCNINDKEADSCLIDGQVDHTLKNGGQAELLSMESELLCMELSIVYRQMRRFCCWAGDECSLELKQMLLS